MIMDSDNSDNSVTSSPKQNNLYMCCWQGEGDEELMLVQEMHSILASSCEGSLDLPRYIITNNSSNSGSDINSCENSDSGSSDAVDNISSDESEEVDGGNDSNNDNNVDDDDWLYVGDERAGQIGTHLPVILQKKEGELHSLFTINNNNNNNTHSTTNNSNNNSNNNNITNNSSNNSTNKRIKQTKKNNRKMNFANGEESLHYFRGYSPYNKSQNYHAAPMKRKRGRPPKDPKKLLQYHNQNNLPSSSYASSINNNNNTNNSNNSNTYNTNNITNNNNNNNNNVYFSSSIFHHPHAAIPFIPTDNINMNNNTTAPLYEHNNHLYIDTTYNSSHYIPHNRITPPSYYSHPYPSPSRTNNNNNNAEDEEKGETTELGEVIHKIMRNVNSSSNSSISNINNIIARSVGSDSNDNSDVLPSSYGIFKEFTMERSKSVRLAEFLAHNIDSLLQLSTKVEISIHDFRNSTLGAKVRQKLENLKTLKKAMELGLIYEEQFEEKQRQFLESFDFNTNTFHHR